FRPDHVESPTPIAPRVPRTSAVGTEKPLRRLSSVGVKFLRKRPPIGGRFRFRHPWFSLDLGMIREWKLARRSLCYGQRTLVMGVLNVTPDSFSDGGRFLSVDRAVAHAQQMIIEGADIIDIGGESTRPGSESVSEQEELRRVIPVIERIASGSSVPISIDTTKPAVA